MSAAGAHADRLEPLGIVREQLEEATAAKKCHSCGCFHEAVSALEQTRATVGDLAPALARARKVLREQKYDCLGCEKCYTAVAQNAFAEAFPGEASAPGGPTGAPAARPGWPPLPGDYTVVRYHAPVVVCTLNSGDLAAEVIARAPAGLALSGTLHTENLGIERVIENVLANPHIRFLVLCGEDTRQSIGHLPGQSLASVLTHGVDEGGRIRGARGKRPVLRNVRAEQVEAFRHQVELVSLIGDRDLDRIATAVNACSARDPGPFEGAPSGLALTPIPAREPGKLVLDPAGFLVIHPDPVRGLVLEHYRNGGVLDALVEGRTAAAVGATAVDRGLVSRLDHAVYLGRELARAEECLRTGVRYVQDRAPGPAPEPDEGGCGCSAGM